jgi:hypothetical protein
MSAVATALPVASSARALPAAAHDFDFLFGRWQVRNRRLRERLAGCDDWEEFEAEVETRPILGGVGNREHFHTAWRGGLHGFALRLFDRAAQRWSIWWASDLTGTLEAPVTGGFERGVGNFYGPDTCNGVAVLSRYRWSDIHATQATWDQAFSTDEGRTWETNWVMQFQRSGE